MKEFINFFLAFFKIKTIILGMKIKSYKKLKNNSYKVTFQDSTEELVLYDEVILKYNLLLKKEISREDLKEIQTVNDCFACVHQALKYLTYKSRSKKEVEEYLKKQKYTKQDIEYTLSLLEERKLINDNAYLQMFINDQMHLTNNGPKKIKGKLVTLGIAEDKIENALAKVPKEVWLEKLEHIINKKIKTNNKDGIRKLKEKILYYCTNEGYQKEDIINILEKIEIPTNSSVLEKEAQKLYKKLALKYSGSALTFQLKGRLYQKGFLTEEIDRVVEDIKKSS